MRARRAVKALLAVALFCCLSSPAHAASSGWFHTPRDGGEYPAGTNFEGPCKPMPTFPGAPGGDTATIWQPETSSTFYSESGREIGTVSPGKPEYIAPTIVAAGSEVPRGCTPISRGCHCWPLSLLPGRYTMVTTSLEWMWEWCADTDENPCALGGPTGWTDSPGEYRGKVEETVTFTVYSAFSQKDKKAFSDAARGWEEVSALWGAGALAASITGAGAVVAPFAGTGAAVGQYGKREFAQLANDPPDQNFKEYANFQLQRVPKLRPRGRIDGETARAISRAFAAQTFAAAVTRAFVSSIERAAGAQLMKNEKWEKKQTLAAADWASKLPAAVERELAAGKRAAAAIRKADLSPYRIAEEDFVEARREAIISQELPEQFQRRLRAAGADETTMGAVLYSLLTVESADAAGPVFKPKLFYSPALAQSLRKSAARARSWAKRARTNPVRD